MPHFDVTYRRTELLTLRVEAANAEEADDLAMGDGDEVASKTIECVTIGVQPAPDDEGEPVCPHCGDDGYVDDDDDPRGGRQCDCRQGYGR